MEFLNGYGFVGLFVVKIVCCGVIVLVVIGVISFVGFVSWLVGGGYFWLVVVVLVIVGIYLWWYCVWVNVKIDGKGFVG